MRARIAEKIGLDPVPVIDNPPGEDPADADRTGEDQAGEDPAGADRPGQRPGRT